MADFNGDSKRDVVTNSAQEFPGQVQFSAGNGNGTFAAAVNYANIPGILGALLQGRFSTTTTNRTSSDTTSTEPNPTCSVP